MRFSSFLISLFLCFSFVACHSDKGKVSAAPKHPDDPRKFGPIELKYADTTTPEWQEKARRLDSFYQVQVRHGFNGAVLVGYKGNVMYERYFGYANKAQKEVWNANTSSQLASTSKTFTGAAVLLLHAHKYLDIDKPVQSYLPTFPYSNITVRMLLNHRSGLPDYLHWVPNYRKDTRTPIYNDQLLALMAKYKPKLSFTPNTRFTYSNTNYATLALVIEAATGMKYKDFMRRYIFEPLGMTQTFVFDPAEGFPENASVSYKASWAIDPVMYADGIYGDKGIYSTLTDMYRWDQSFYKNILLDNETLEMAYGPCSFEKPGIKNYGLGWRMLCYPDGYKVIYHNGWWHGNNTCFYRFIEDNFTIIVLGNKYNSAIYRQPPVVYNIINGDAGRSDFGGDE